MCSEFIITFKMALLSEIAIAPTINTIRRIANAFWSKLDSEFEVKTRFPKTRERHTTDHLERILCINISIDIQ